MLNRCKQENALFKITQALARNDIFPKAIELFKQAFPLRLSVAYFIPPVSDDQKNRCF